MRNDDIERELDRALTKYAAVEPRDGLEQRLWANLRARRTRATRFTWGHLAAVGFTVAAFAVLAFVVGERRSAIVKPGPVVIQHEPAQASGAHGAAANADLSVERPQQSQNEPTAGSAKRPRNKRLAQANGEPAPKLAQFPAPEPLTEQEMLLIQFVQQDPADAALFAEVRAKELQRVSDEMQPLEDDTDLQEGHTY